MTVTPPAHPTLGTPEKTYPYTDREGQILFYVCRFKTKDGKTFRQGHPNGSGWEWSLNGIEPVLYRMPELWAHLEKGSKAPIWIVEGEKDADALAALGETATCNPMGAGKWRSEFTELLTGARLVHIVADLDDIGEKHARSIWWSIDDYVDQAIIFHAPENLGKGADISDLLEEGYELDSLVTIPPQAPALIEGDEAGGVRLATQTIKAFSAVDEPTGDPLLGTGDKIALSMGGMLVLYGDGGAGKTTMELDLIMHLASGTPWLGLPVALKAKILVIENEGPRGMFRRKTRAKLTTWTGTDVGDNIHILEDPWAVFSFAKEGYREQLRDLIEEHEFDVIAAGPVNRLGMEGGGTPDQVGAFILNIELLRATLERPVAVIFAHHENKAGDVSGAWEGVPDTLAHVQAQGPGKTRLFWQKVRWGPDIHQKTWTLAWRDGESFEQEEKEEITDADIEAMVRLYITENPGCSWLKVETDVPGNAARKRKARDALIFQELVENRGSGNRYHLYPSSVQPVQPVLGLDIDMDDKQTDAAPHAGTSNPSIRPTYKGTDSGRDGLRQTTPDPDADIPF